MEINDFIRIVEVFNQQEQFALCNLYEIYFINFSCKNISWYEICEKFRVSFLTFLK